MRLFVDNLTNIDFSYLCPERGLVGETWLANIELTGELDQQGMICDFGVVKRYLRDWLGQHLDHCLLVPASNPSICINDMSTQIQVTLICENKGTFTVEAPRESVCLVATETVTPATVAAWCESQMVGMLGNSGLSLSFSCEHIATPYYHYSHGLKKHGGDCQRIAHGHRSKLQIWRNGEPAEDLVQKWADKWRDIYIATAEDCIAQAQHELTFAYQSSQGKFKLVIPRSSCYLIDTDTTVEFIAQHLAHEISSQYPGERILVKAYEGIGKGAIAERSS